MKKILLIVGLVVMFLCISYLELIKPTDLRPHTYYRVYLNKEVIGVIKDKSELEKYVSNASENYKKQFGVTDVYIPNGLEIKKFTTYNKKTDNVKDIYEKISQIEPFTVEGYRFTVNRSTVNENGESITNSEFIYVLDNSVFDEAIRSLYKIFVGTEIYENYLNNAQVSINGTGSVIENIYVNDDISVKKMRISVVEPIYTDVSTLTKYLLFGTTVDQKKYVVKMGEDIEQVAFDNKISVEELLISNPEFTSSKNLLFPGQEITIGVMDPKVSVAVLKYTVEDITNKYSTTVEYDATQLVGYSQVTQAGSNGLERVSQKVLTVNGTIHNIIPISKVELKPVVNEVIVKGERVVPNTGSLYGWKWPTNSGYTLLSGFEYRINPITGKRELHDGLDIGGTGYGSPIYAANNGVITQKATRFDNGIYIIINHNNGYYTIYCHMSKFADVEVGQTVEAGQIIGYMGRTGYATTAHLHFSVSYGGRPWGGGVFINPLTLYR